MKIYAVSKGENDTKLTTTTTKMIKTEKPPMTDEEKKADRARRQADLNALLAQAEREAKVQTESAESMANARAKEGCVTLNGMFISCRIPGANAAKTAAEGQGGGGGGGKKKNDPPMAIDVMPFVRALAAHQVPGLEYRVKSPTCIEIPARNVDRIKEVREKMKKVTLP
jgi:hypothetical protein